MLQFEEILQKVTDTDLAASLLERLELVAHKLKFMDQVPVLVQDGAGNFNGQLSAYLPMAGGFPVEYVEGAVYLICYEQGTDLNHLMQVAPGWLDPEWDVFKNHRIAFMAATFYDLSDAEQQVRLVEDLAELLHPGVFVFGQEGGSWVRFGS